MSEISHVFPRQKAPELKVDTLGGGQWSLHDQKPEKFTLVVVYRGLHCPICKPYLREIDRKLEDFRALGIEVIALSTDTEERAKKAKSEWGIENLTIGYGLDLDTARDWGLYISTSIGKTSSGYEEPKQFAEPGLFLVRTDGTIYFASVQTMPFARPRIEDVLGAAKIVIDRDYPARGEVLDHAIAAE